jgi:hypothetical protein
MRRVTKVAIAAVVSVALIAFFFFAPVFYWFAFSTVSFLPHQPVYRSLGCATVGFGDVYSPGYGGFIFGCALPPFI